jgi:putative polyketide hydroxylase
MSVVVDSFDEVARATIEPWVEPLGPTAECEVLVIGGGPVGLTLGTLLARSIVPTIVVERHPGPSLHPKARGIFPRTLEVFRQINMADDLVDIGTAIAGEIHYVSSSANLAAADHQRVSLLDGVDFSAHSMYSPVLVGQDVVERLLLRRAKLEHLPVHFGVELIALDEADGRMRATLQHRVTGATTVVSATHVVGCDGARSSVRRLSGIDFDGTEDMGAYMNVLFDADLAALVDGRRSVGYQVADAAGSFMAVDNRRRWLFNFRGEEAELDALDEAQLAARIHTGIGRTDIDVRIVSAVKWSPAAKLASQYRKGNVFLCGDAAHVIPPVGAMGMNLGVQDAHNLWWKLAGTYYGNCGPDILDTYESERRPIGERTVAAAASSQMAAVAPSERPSRPPALGNLGLTLGYAYDGAGVIDEDEGPAPAYTDDDVVFTGRPGERLPHFVMTMMHGRVPLSAMVGPSFALFGGGQSMPWLGSIPFVNLVMVLPEMDPDGRFCPTFGVEPDGVILVRPDGVVAWRQRSWTDDGPDRLRSAYRRARMLP